MTPNFVHVCTAACKNGRHDMGEVGTTTTGAYVSTESRETPEPGALAEKAECGCVGWLRGPVELCPLHAAAAEMAALLEGIAKCHGCARCHNSARYFLKKLRGENNGR